MQIARLMSYHVHQFSIFVCLFVFAGSFKQIATYSSSNKKRNIPIYFNINYHTEMKLVPVIMD